MPPKKVVLSLTQISINSLTKLLVDGLNPHFLIQLKTNYVGNSNLNADETKLSQNTDDLLIEESAQKDKDCIVNDKIEETVCAENESVSKSKASHNHEVGQEAEISEEVTLDEEQASVNLLNEVEEFLMSLASDLTSHAHCSLQELLFWSILSPLNSLYVKHQCQVMRRIIRDIVPLFINASLKTLDFGCFKMLTEAQMFETIYSRLNRAKGLEKLVFGRCCYWRSGAVTHLNRCLEGMTELRVLHIHYICHPDMIQGLPQSCPQLRELSLKGSKNITDEEGPVIAQFKKLDTLDISGTSITGRGCRSLVLGLPYLTWLTHCPFNCNSDTLIFESRAELFNYIKDQLHRQPALISNQSERGSSDVYVPALTVEGRTPISSETEGMESLSESRTRQEAFTLKLKSFWLFNTTTEELLLTNLCPQLEHLRLDFVMQDLVETPDMEAISHLPHLSSLALYTYDQCPIVLVTNVVEFAPRLTTLHLHLGDAWFFVAPVVNVIAMTCHNLVSLAMEGDYKGQHSLEESDSRLDFTLPTEGLRHLREARLDGCISDARLLHLLTQAPRLQTLRLDGELEWLHDDTFTDAINSNLLLELKELWFNVSAGITFSSVRRLLLSPNHLERVGRLCLMSSATKEAYQDLLRLLRKLNLATELIWVTDQRELVLNKPQPAERIRLRKSQLTREARQP